MSSGQRTALASIVSIAVVSFVVFAFLWFANTTFPGVWILVAVVAFTCAFGVTVMLPTYVVVCRIRNPVPWGLAMTLGFAVPLLVSIIASGLGGSSGYFRLGQHVLQDSSGLTVWGWWNALLQALAAGGLGALGTFVFGWIQGFESKGFG